MKENSRWLSKHLITGTIMLLLLFTMLGKFGEWHWLLDLFSHFAIQYFFLNFFLLTISLLVYRKNYANLTALVPTHIINCLSLLPFYQSKGISRSISSREFKFTSININSQNTNWEKFADYVRKYDPDVIILTELTPSFGVHLVSLKNDYPYGKAVMDNGNFGIGIISKIPLEQTKIHRQSNSQIPYISAKIQFFNSILNIVAIHPFPPIGAEGTQLRNEYFDDVSKFIQKTQTPSILCGDFNATPWSHPFKKLLSETKLRLPQGSGLVPSWPSSLPFLRIPIDHCLATENLRVGNYSRGPNIGSDHFPFEMRIQLPAAK